MNLLSIVAFIFAGFVLGYGIITSGNVEVFLNQHAFLIVVGGSVAAAAISFQIDRILVLFKVFFKRVIQGRKLDYVTLIRELMTIGEAFRKKSPELDKLVNSNQDFFLKEAFSLVREELLEEEVLIRILRTRINTIYQRQMEEMVKFRTVGKYPPAFGLMGTTLSMISLLQKLGQPGGQKLIGPSMAVGLVATFFGLALANLVFNPISENLQDSAKENRIKNLIIVEGVRLILQGTSPVILAEELNSFLIPSERIDWKKIEGVGKAS
ncbi:MAG: MotA/TolQ/ExbB proton channel family protein [Bdellovibrionia bacterium]